MPSLFRRLTHSALEVVPCHGVLLDIGGEQASAYQQILARTATRIVTLNIDASTQPDILADIEHPLPCDNESFDTVCAINVLEHVFSHQQLLQEMARVVRPGGSVLIVVPFLFPIHPSPQDYFRYTHSALERLVHDVGLRVVTIRSIGTGVCAAVVQCMHTALPTVLHRPLQWVAVHGDAWVSWIAKKMGKKYQASDYPLGYLVLAKKS